jgi:hypothetical protein
MKKFLIFLLGITVVLALPYLGVHYGYKPVFLILLAFIIYIVGQIIKRKEW